MHEKMMWDIEELEFSKKVRLWLDSGFEGFNPENAEINRPKKKPKRNWTCKLLPDKKLSYIS